MAFYNIEIRVEELADGGDYRYLATSSDLPGLLVAGDTAEEVLTQAPRVAEALIASLKAAGDALPAFLQTVPALPFASHITVAARNRPS